MMKDALKEVDAKKQELQNLKAQLKKIQDEINEKESLQNKEQKDVTLHYEEKVRKLEAVV